MIVHSCLKFWNGRNTFYMELKCLLLFHTLEGDKQLSLSSIYYNPHNYYKLNPTTTIMKISVYATTALAAATSFSCFVSATAAAASRKRKIMKKVGATGQTNSDGIPIGDPCTRGDDNCAIPPGLDHGVCRGGTCKVNIYGGSPPTYCEGYVCQSGQPGSSCGVTTDCVVPPGLDHAVCRKGRCQR